MRAPIVYLDQNAAISLARAYYGRPGGERFLPALLSVHRAWKDRVALFPLSGGHFWETNKRGDPGSRERLARFLFALSRNVRMAGLHQTAEPELSSALRALFALPNRVATPSVFGVGVAHAFSNVADNRLVYELPVGLPESVREELRELYDNMVELASLGAATIDGQWRPDDVVAEKCAAGERDLARRIQGWCGERDGFSKKEKVRRLVMLEEMKELLPRVVEGCRSLGVSPDVIVRSLRGAEALLRCMPTHWLNHRLHRLGHENFTHRWEANDLIDLGYLSVAGVHCDIVVTEKRWAHYLKRCGRDVHAEILDSVADLPARLDKLA